MLCEWVCLHASHDVPHGKRFFLTISYEPLSNRGSFALHEHNFARILINVAFDGRDGVSEAKAALGATKAVTNHDSASVDRREVVRMSRALGRKLGTRSRSPSDRVRSCQKEFRCHRCHPHVSHCIRIVSKSLHEYRMYTDENGSETSS